jgi:hypothetical protein
MLVVLGLVVSLFLLQYAYWLYLIRQGNITLQQEQQVSLAASQYQKAVGWTPPLVGRIPGLREPLREALLKQAQLFYLQRKLDQGLEFFQGLPSQYSFLEHDWEYHLWYGNTLFLRAIFHKDPQALVNDLQGTLREYQTALELNPASWDARFNYEFIKQALVSEGKEGAQRLELLLEDKARDRRRQEKLPPEKIG